MSSRVIILCFVALSILHVQVINANGVFSCNRPSGANLIDNYIPEDQATLLEQKLWKRCTSIPVVLHVANQELPTNNVTLFYEVDHVYAGFFPQVDEFTSMIVPLTQNISVNGSVSNSTSMNYNLTFYDDPTVYIWLNITGIYTTTPRFFKCSQCESASSAFVGAFTAVVNVDKGNITSIEWDDDGCKGCNEGYYVGFKPACNCGLAYDTYSSECLNANVTDIDSTVSGHQDVCDMKVYLVWAGTDQNGEKMQSLSFAPSQFAKYSAINTFQAAAGVADTNYFPSSS